MDYNETHMPCIYTDEMKALGIDAKCYNMTLRKKRYCKNHNKCKQCGLFTELRQRHYCPRCICKFKECGRSKIEGSDDCGNHGCSSCQKEKDFLKPFCDNCICPTKGCNNAKFQKREGCYTHTCSNCERLMRNGNCSNAACRCKTCHHNKVNEVACHKHTCRICKDLYKTATSFLWGPDPYDEVVHVITDKSHPEIRIGQNRPDYCPNMKVLSCSSFKIGYTKSDNCLKFVPDIPYGKIDMCGNCYEFNKCQLCRNTRSTNPDILHFGYYYDACMTVGKCKKCETGLWCHEPYVERPKLCHKCNGEVLYCNKCDKIFEKRSIQLIDYNKNGFNSCATCDIQVIFDNRVRLSFEAKECVTYRKSAFICWRISYIDKFIGDVNDIHQRFNPMGIDCKLIFEAVLTLQWESQNREMYIDSLISFLSMENDERFASRLSRINKGMNVIYFKESQYSSAEYQRINLIGVFVRCAMLPKDMFMMILKML